MKNREKAYRVIERTLEFPDWFGHNPDALADKLLSCFREITEENEMVYIEKE